MKLWVMPFLFVAKNPGLVHKRDDYVLLQASERKTNQIEDRFGRVRRLIVACSCEFVLGLRLFKTQFYFLFKQFF